MPRVYGTLLMEMAKIQTEKNRHEEGTAAPVVATPPRRTVGRPTDLAKAGAAAGQQALRWQRGAGADADRME